MNMNVLVKILWIWLWAMLALGVYWGFTQPDYFTNEFMREDGFIEYATVVLLLASVVLVIGRWRKYRAHQNWKFSLICGLIVVAFLFVAGEEISWGQRIFNLETTDYFKEHNTQEELNLHNLTVGDVKINKLIFGLILTTVILIYTILVPILYTKITAVKSLLDAWYIPVPTWRQSISYVVLMVLISIIPASKNWELLEFGSVLIFFLILLNPRNKAVLEPSKNL